MFALADPTTTRLLRALSTDGASTAAELATRLTLPPGAVNAVLRQGLTLGIVRLLPGSLDHFEIVREAVVAAVEHHRQQLFGATR